MNRQKSLILVVALALIAGTGLLLGRMRTHQKLGAPGVKAHAIPGEKRLQVDLPETVLDFKSEWIDADKIALATLPADTSFGQRVYTAPDDWKAAMNVVLMGTDRTSIHKPQFCLEGAGWHIDQAASRSTTIHIERPQPYELPVVELLATMEINKDGQVQRARGIYVYWFVCEDALSASVSGFERMWWMASKLLRTGVLQRWAYVSCFSTSNPGQEEAAFERMKKLIAAAVPEFQLYPRPKTASAAHP